MMIRKTALGGLLAFLLILSLGLWVTPASAYTVRWSGQPGIVTFDSPKATMGYNTSGLNNLQLEIRTIGPSAGAGTQYAQIHLHAYYSCTTGWCTAGQQNWTTIWFSTPLNVSSVAFSVAVPTGRYYTYVAQTTWYNANRTIVGQETYYPTAGGMSVFTNGQPYWGNNDFACVGYAVNRGVCRPWGRATASFSPTGNLYVLWAASCGCTIPGAGATTANSGFGTRTARLSAP